MIALPTPHLLFLGDVTNPLDAKTAMGLRDWRPDDCVGQYRLPGCAVDLGLPDMDFTAAAAAGATSVVIGVAPSGGARPGRFESDGGLVITVSSLKASCFSSPSELASRGLRCPISASGTSCPVATCSRQACTSSSTRAVCGAPAP